MSEEEKQAGPKVVAQMEIPVTIGENDEPAKVGPARMMVLGITLTQQEDKSFVGASMRGAQLKVSFRDPRPDNQDMESFEPVEAELSFHQTKYAVSGDDVANIEEQLTELLLEDQRAIDFLLAQAAAPLQLVRALFHFLVEWSRLPPLVRAGHAAGLMGHMRDRVRRERSDIKFFTETAPQMSRRIGVLKDFERADIAVFELAMKLAIQADVEATARGIDADRVPSVTERVPERDPVEVNREMLKTAAARAKTEEERAQIAKLQEALDTAPARPSFTDELRDLINRHSKENGSDTPDFALAQFMSSSLEAFEAAVVVREKHAGRR